MTMNEFYQAIGVDMNTPLRRFAGSERMLAKFLNRITTDNSYAQLSGFIGEKNWPEAFRMAHTLKGVCLNLELTPLAKAAGELTEFLRNNTDAPAEDTVQTLYAKVTEEYERTMKLIHEIQ